MPLQRETMPSSRTVRTMQSNMPLNLLRPVPPTMAKLLSWVCNKSLALSIGATIVCTTPPITAPAIRSRWKFVNQSDGPQDVDDEDRTALLFSGSSSSSLVIISNTQVQHQSIKTLSFFFFLKLCHGIVSEKCSKWWENWFVICWWLRKRKTHL